MGKPLTVDQQNRIALFVGQAANRSPKPLSAIVLFRRDMAEKDRVVGNPVLVSPPPGKLALMVTHTIERERIKPGAKGRLAAERADRLTQPYADFLRDIFRIRLRAAPAPRHGVDKIVMRLDERTESAPVAITSSLNQFRAQFRVRISVD